MKQGITFPCSFWAASDLRTLFASLLALTWCAFLIVFRIIWTHSLDYSFLVWNLGLAVAPLVFVNLALAQSNLHLRIAFCALWLLFFPNAPYIITDFVHLRTINSAPIWFDILLLASSAGTGLAIAYISLAQIHDQFVAAQKQFVGWLLAIASLVLASFGIYLGRFLRWRSIDIALNPLGLFTDITDRIINPLAHTRAWGVTLGFTIFLALGYILFRNARGFTSWQR